MDKTKFYKHASLTDLAGTVIAKGVSFSCMAWPVTAKWMDIYPSSFTVRAIVASRGGAINIARVQNETSSAVV